VGCIRHCRRAGRLWRNQHF